tara:strand:+ start:649 stop:1104 length:456 start_codon:yes stop_codon:yes gene_type:complete
MIFKLMWWAVLFIVGMVFGLMTFGSAEIVFGEDDEGAWFMFDRVLSQEIISVFRSHYAITNIQTDSADRTTTIWYDPNLISNKQILDYFGAFESSTKRNREKLTNFQNTPIPNCFNTWDNLNNPTKTGSIGIYYLSDGSEVKILNDLRCNE